MTLASSASAVPTLRKVRETMILQMNWDCYHWYAGLDFNLWRCAIALYQFPQCWVSSLPSGRGRYLCEGKFMQKSRLQRDLYRVCRDRVRYDRRGKRIVHIIGPCQEVGPPGARDQSG